MDILSGAGIGSQISPLLSNLAVTLVERSWSESFAEILGQLTLHICSVRYVDNRFLICSAHHFHTDALKTLWFGLLWAPRWTWNCWWWSVTGFWSQYTGSNCKISPARIRDCVSAGSLRLRLSGLKSRAHLIRKYTYPPDLVFASLSQLGTLYVQKGFNQADVYQALQL